MAQSRRKGEHGPDGTPEWAELIRLRDEVEAQLRALDAKIESLKREGETRPKRVPMEAQANIGFLQRPGRMQRSVRVLVLDALEDLTWLAYSRELALFVKARFGRPIPSERFGTLANDEVQAYQQSGRPRAVWLCFALTHDRFEPIKRLWGRSDWPLEYRIVAPTTGRVQHLKVTARLCDLALRADEVATDPEMLRIIAADHARDLPGVRFQQGVFDLEAWRDRALDDLGKVGPRDEELRKEAAQSLSRRAEVFQLFGVPEIIEGADVSQRNRMRSR